MAPDVGFEPTTKRLTAAYSTAELIWIKGDILHKNLQKSSADLLLSFYKKQFCAI